jgi:hypothetical protein
MAAQNCRTPFDAGFGQLRVQRLKALRHRHRRHEIAPEIADQPFDFAFVIALAGPTEPVWRFAVDPSSEGGRGSGRGKS